MVRAPALTGMSTSPSTFGGVELGAAYVKFALNAVDDGCQGLSDPLLAEFGGNVGL